MLNSISIDVEEYFHAANLEPVTPPASWHRLPRRVQKGMDQILEIFSDAGIHGTFFVLGYVARRHPQLVRQISNLGHEIASHGYGHRLVYHQTPGQFFRDIRKTKFLLEDLTGQAVVGYRAPSFSIHESWAYDELLLAGYKYDSSLYPVKHPRYGSAGRLPDPHILTRPAGQIVEIPLATAALTVGPWSMRLPVAGGAYWRLLPEIYSHWGLRRRSAEGGVHCYAHPWEFDAEMPVYKELGFLTRVRHYAGTKKFAERFRRLTATLPFGPINRVVEEILQQNSATVVHWEK